MPEPPAPAPVGHLEVRGGAGGTAVGLDDLEAAAGCLAECARRLVEGAARLATLAADPAPAASAPVSPGTAALAGVALLRVAGPTGLAGEAVRLGALATATATAVTAYRAGEAAVVAATGAAQSGVMGVLGRCLPELAVAVLTLDALGVDVAARLDAVVTEHPGVVELSGGVDGLVAGLRTDPRVGWLLLPGVVAPAGARGGDGTTYEAGLAVLAGAAAAWGLLRDGDAAAVTPATASAGTGAPRGLADLARDLGRVARATDPGRVRVVQVCSPAGSAWVVEVSGTRSWDPRGGDEAFDLTSDVRLLAGASSVLAAGVEEALEQAQSAAGRSGADDPVLLVGHSLGGITATALAASPAFTARHRVTHVVTMGSPVARMPVPPSVAVLSLEHDQDPVPRLEGRANPDRLRWVTVARAAALPQGHAVRAAHSLEEYAVTAAAVDRAGGASLEGWREGTEVFFRPGQGGAVVVRDYTVRREGGS